METGTIDGPLEVVSIFPHLAPRSSAKAPKAEGSMSRVVQKLSSTASPGRFAAFTASSPVWPISAPSPAARTEPRVNEHRPRRPCGHLP